jgi:SHS2 domain-containing protein
MGFRLVDHTADMAFEVRADSLEELFEDSAYAFYEAFVYTEKLREDEVVEVELRETEIDFLLYKWLTEILYLLDTSFFAAKKLDVKVEKCNGDYNLKAQMSGGKVSPQIIKTEPKAITMHNFQVEKVGREWKAFVIVDI